jgi:hypothetical protein
MEGSQDDVPVFDLQGRLSQPYFKVSAGTPCRCAIEILRCRFAVHELVEMRSRQLKHHNDPMVIGGSQS